MQQFSAPKSFRSRSFKIRQKIAKTLFYLLHVLIIRDNIFRKKDVETFNIILATKKQKILRPNLFMLWDFQSVFL